MNATDDEFGPGRHRVPSWAAGLAGAVAVAVALGLVELLAGTTTQVASAVDAVSQQVIPRTPETVTRWAIGTFGTDDIVVLNAGTTVLALVIGAVTGLAARRRAWLPVVVFVAFGLLGAVAVSARSEVSVPLSVLALTAGIGLALLVLRSLLARAGATSGTVPADGADRRRFLALAGTASIVAAAAAATGRSLLRGTLAVVDTAAVALPGPARALPSPPADAAFDVPGLAPLFTPNRTFFVIDTAVAVPQVDPSTWSLRIHGRVDRELTLSYEDLLALPLEEVDVTLSCVSNEVGGDLVGTARWLGVRLERLLERVGVGPGAEQLLGRSTDGFTAGFPVDLARDGRDAVVAIGMNGAPLPAIHGFPARLVVPGLYGYVSATKWLSEIELTTWDVDGYWIPRGWAKEGPTKTQSRIDVPARGDQVPAGDVVVAGVAWAPVRGVERVEVRLDGGPWTEAARSAPLAAGTWVQWRATVRAGPGEHHLEVRATDGDGRAQARGPAPPAPDGAEGWHQVGFRAV